MFKSKLKSTQLAIVDDNNNEYIVHEFEKQGLVVKTKEQLKSAISKLSSSEGTIIVVDNIIIDEDITVPENVMLKFYKGGKLTVNSGCTLTLDCAIDAGLFPIFDGNGAIDLSKAVKSVVTVDTIKELVLKTANIDGIGCNVNVLGYHEPGDGGGGYFYWDANEDKANHNGGTIIDPNIAFPTDWSNTTQQSTWFTAGTGSGCWKRIYSNAVNVKDFGAVGDGVTDDTQAIQAALNTGKDIFIPAGTYIVSGLIWDTYNNIHGAGWSTILKNTIPGTDLITIGGNLSWFFRTISNLHLIGNPELNNNGINFSTYMAGRIFYNTIAFDYFDKAVFKSKGNIGNVILNCRFYNTNFNWYAQSDPSIHNGTDLFVSCDLEHANLASIFYLGHGAQISIRDCSIASNPGFGLFIKDQGFGKMCGTSIESTYFERNGEADNVIIDGISYAPTNIYIENSQQILFYNTALFDVHLVDSYAKAEDCWIDFWRQLNLENSKLENTNSFVTQSQGDKIIVDSLAYFDHNKTTIVLKQPPRDKLVHSFSENLKYSKLFDDSTSISWDNLSSTQVEDSLNHTYSSQFTIPSGPGKGLFNLATTTINKYLLTLMNIKLLSGNIQLQLLGRYDSTKRTRGTIELTKPYNQWISVVMFGLNDISEVLNLYVFDHSGTSSDFRINDLEIFEFDTQLELLDFLNSKYIALI